MTHPSELPTPAALVDLDVAARNSERMRGRVERLGARLRPHVKTHKCVEIARMQLGADSGPITVSTLAEARHFAAAGFDDVTWAVPISLGRIDEAVQLARSLRRLTVLVDHAEAITALDAAAARHGRRATAMLEIDCGHHRTGVDPAGEEALELARALDRSAHVEFAGVLTHGGHAYARAGREALAAVAAQERGAVVGFAERLRRDGIEVGETSLGSTPTLSVAEELGGVTEARPGNYVFHDAFQAAIGSCELGDVAFSVLATVISTRADLGQIVIDAGALALSKDAGATHVDPEPGYGIVCDAEGAPIEGLRVTGLSQEHGVVRGPPPAIAARRIGERLRVIPNHSCLAAALHARYHGVRGGRVVERLEPSRGW